MIVLDGGSTDGTREIIETYVDKLAYFHSRPDHGLYDALNQALRLATGDYISVLNSGDRYTSPTSLRDSLVILDQGDLPEVIYGHSVEINPEWDREVRCIPDNEQLKYHPTFRHGSCLIKREIHQQHPFPINTDHKNYSSDWQLLHDLYLKGYSFQPIDVFIESYRAEGMSNHPYRNLWYNYQITREGGKFDGLGHQLKCLCYLLHNLIYVFIKGSILYRFSHTFFLKYMINSILPHITLWTLRRAYLRLIGMQIGKGTHLDRKIEMINPNLIKIGAYSDINAHCLLDGRGGITIGSSVSISHRVCLMTGSHDYRSPHFQGIFHPIVIEDYVWIGVGATILQGVTLGRGSVVCAGAVVTHDVPPYTVVAGVPAQPISTRPQNLDYKCKHE